jgi:hypothetical protein
MRKDSVYKNFYKNILANDLGIGFSIQNIYKVPSLQRITMHNTSHAPLSKRGEIFSPWAASLLIGGRRGNLLVSNKSVAGFKLKEKSLLGCSLSLRGDPLYQFLDKFLLETLPRELSNRAENWTPAMEWEFVYSVGEFFVPCIGEKTVFPAGPAVASQPLANTGYLQTSKSPVPGTMLQLPHRRCVEVHGNYSLGLLSPPGGASMGSFDVQRSSPNVSYTETSHATTLSPPESGYITVSIKRCEEDDVIHFRGIEHPTSEIPVPWKMLQPQLHLRCQGRGGAAPLGLRFDQRKEKPGKEIFSSESSQHSYGLSPIELERKLSGKSRGVKSLSKEYNLGVSFCFSFRELESSFHLFEYLRGFDITFLFSTIFKISSPGVTEDGVKK